MIAKSFAKMEYKERYRIDERGKYIVVESNSLVDSDLCTIKRLHTLLLIFIFYFVRFYGIIRHYKVT